MKPWMCSKCFKRFADPTPVKMHIRDKHAGDGNPQRAPKSERRYLSEKSEPSMADLAIQAELDRAMGIPNDDDWLLP